MKVTGIHPHIKALYMSDEKIIELYWERNEQAIVETNQKYGKYLQTFTCRFLSDMTEAEECVNDVYYDVWKAIPPSKPKSLKAFLIKIARCSAIERYRAKTREKRPNVEAFISLTDFSDYIPSSYDLDQEILAKEISNVVNEYLKCATARKKYIFVARYYMSYSVSEITKKLNVSESTVNKEIRSIKDELKGKLKERGCIS